MDNNHPQATDLQKTMKPDKDQSIETLRGIAIVLVVIAHVIGSNENCGLQVTNDSFLRWFYTLTSSFRMPLFTVISGYVYAMRPLRAESVIPFSMGKARRLVLPLFFVSTLQFLARYLTPGTNTSVKLNEMWKIYAFSFDQFWFLQAIILVFACVIVIECFNLLSNIKGWLLCFSAALIAKSILPLTIILFSFSGFLFLLPCFILGVGLYRFHETLINNRIAVLTGLLFLLGTIGQQLVYFNIWSYYLQRESTIGVIYGMIACLFFFNVKRGNRLLARLGYYAFGIYLFHVFGQAGSRIIFKYIGIDNIAILFCISLICGLGLPIIVEQIIEKNRISRLLLLGQK